VNIEKKGGVGAGSGFHTADSSTGFGRDAGFSDAGFAAQNNYVAIPRPDGLPALKQDLQFFLATNERNEADASRLQAAYRSFCDDLI
jgi:hypothetical protein